MKIVNDIIHDAHVHVHVHEEESAHNFPKHMNHNEDLNYIDYLEVEGNETCDSIMSLPREESLESLQVRVMYYVENECFEKMKLKKSGYRVDAVEKMGKLTGSTDSGKGPMFLYTFIWVILLILIWIFIG